MSTLLDPDIIRHLHSSLALYIKPVSVAINIPLFVEGVDKEIASAFNQDSAVLRINGPVYSPFQGEDRYQVEVFIMMTDLVRQTDNAYKLFTDTGKMAEALSNTIPINRHGIDGSLIGCLIQDRGSRDFVRVANYGIVEKDTRVRQMAVIAKYELSI